VTATIRTLPVHEVVRRAYPRPPPEEKDHVAMAMGKAIDGALSQFGYEYREGRRPTAAAMRRYGERVLDEGLEEATVTIPAAERARLLAQLESVVQAYRRSELLGLPRPHSRVILIDGEVGVYAQPDYWDGRSRIFEMKSYPAIPPPPDVALQLRLFQLAFPGLETVLVCLNRHATPVTTTSATIPAPTPAEARDALLLALRTGREAGEEKVLEYVTGPFVHYATHEGFAAAGP
jgi:hypothetical protein